MRAVRLKAALGMGLGFGIALFAKPFLFPLAYYFDGSLYPLGLFDTARLAFHGGGIAIAIAGFVASAPEVRDNAR